MTGLSELCVKCDVDSIILAASKVLDNTHRVKDMLLLEDILAVTRHAKTQGYLYCSVPMSQYKLIYRDWEDYGV